MPNAPSPLSRDQESAGLRSELNLRKRQIDAIRRVSGELSTQLDADEMLHKTLAVAVEVLGADVGSLQLYDFERDELVFRCVHDPAAERLLGTAYPASQGIGGQVFRSGEGIITQRAREQDNFYPAIDALTGYHTESMLTAPLRSLDNPSMGVMQVLNAHRPFDASDLAVLEALAAQAAMAIENARRVRDAQRAELVSIVGDIAHDIKNMLTPLKVGTVTLQMVIEDCLHSIDRITALCPPGQDWGGAITGATSSLRDNYTWVLNSTASAAERVHSSTREIAEAVKGELASPNFAVNDLNGVTTEVLSALRPVAEQAGIEFIEVLDPHLPHLQFDQRQLFNAIYNLVNNAIPETPSGGSVTATTYATPTDVFIAIEDTGCGIPDNVKAGLFTENTISTKLHGTGLGTRIVAGVMRKHSGSVEVESEEGRGTRFTLRLPRHNSAQHPV